MYDFVTEYDLSLALRELARQVASDARYNYWAILFIIFVSAGIAKLAKGKGYEPWDWFMFGILLWPAALLIMLIRKPKFYSGSPDLVAPPAPTPTPSAPAPLKPIIPPQPASAQTIRTLVLAAVGVFALVVVGAWLLTPKAPPEKAPPKISELVPKELLTPVVKDSPAAAESSTPSQIQYGSKPIVEVLPVNNRDDEKMRAQIDKARRDVEVAEREVGSFQRDLKRAEEAWRKAGQSEELGLERDQVRKSLDEARDRVTAARRRVQELEEEFRKSVK